MYSKLFPFAAAPVSRAGQVLGILSTRLFRVLAAVGLTLLATFVWYRIYWHAGPAYSSSLPLTGGPSRGNGRLHLLIPATSTNDDLCKLMLSAQILGYPTPVLINYGEHEEADAYVQHLAKVQGILRYLESIEPSIEWDEDLVLIVDGYDIWFQLRPDVLLERYYAINAAADARAVDTYGAELVAQHDIRQTVVFGPDKLCWPVDFSRTACWAIPEVPQDDDIYGPRFEINNRNKNPARFLNSGTILGPLEDMKEVFRATMDRIRTNHTTDSDQFYFANVFGDQEYARLARKPELLEQARSKVYIDREDTHYGSMIRTEPQLSAEVKTEYHIGIDYESSMFQTIAFWKQHLPWTRVVDAWVPPPDARIPPSNPWHMRLEADIQRSAPPFDALHDRASHPGWDAVELPYNTVMHIHPVLVHVTGNMDEKGLRARLWSRNWFQRDAEALRLAQIGRNQTLVASRPIGGLTWSAADMGEDSDELEWKGRGGAWTDRGGWMSWKGMCKRSVESLYNVSTDHYFHPSFYAQPQPMVEEMEMEMETGNGTAPPSPEPTNRGEEGIVDEGGVVVPHGGDTADGNDAEVVPPLPAGWISKWDPRYQRMYYVEMASGMSQWELPQ
jgi:hypothetical protein